MNIFAPLGSLFSTVGYLLSHGGWVVFLFVGLYMLWLLFVLYKENRFIYSHKWITLAIDVPKENEQTFLAVEQFFAQLHSIHENFTFGEYYFGGERIMWISLEIVSFGGQIKYMVHTPEKFLKLIESALYAQYPGAEIRKVEDYMKNLPPYNAETSYYDLFGTELKLIKEDAYPIRTYRAFEHQASQIIVDPLAGVLEALATAKPHELIAVQYIIRPIDDDWKESARELVKKLIGTREEAPKKSGIGDIFDSVLNGILGIFIAAGEAETKKTMVREEPPTLMMHLSPGEKDVVAAIQQNISKIGYQTKIRLLYLAPKDKFRKEAKQTMVGAFRQFDDTNLNGLKPDTRKTWTVVHYKFSKTLETPFVKFLSDRRKKRFIRFFKARSFSKGAKFFILNIEELATVFHFPLVTVKTPQVTKTEITKGEAPINLPIST
ncbi:MAG TPA: hypothetical protein VJK50_02810 [Patescibacteria group bacterium]|nr:hypothetical protein [Patescibacteria group bacterium]